MKNRGRIFAQIIEVSRNNVDLFDTVEYGTITFHIKGGDVWRVEMVVSVKVKEPNTPSIINKGGTAKNDNEGSTTM